LSLVASGVSKKQPILRPQAYQFPRLDVEAVLAQDPQHLPLGEVLLPELFDSREQLIVSVHGVLLEWETPLPKLVLERSLAIVW
jgi:hypothetical protein